MGSGLIQQRGIVIVPIQPGAYKLQFQVILSDGKASVIGFCIGIFVREWLLSTYDYMKHKLYLKQTARPLEPTNL